MVANLILATLVATLLVMVLAVWLSRYLVSSAAQSGETAHAVGEGDFGDERR